MLCNPITDHTTPDACKPSMNDVVRVFAKIYNGATSNFAGAIDADAYATAIQTEATWDTEIALTGADKLVGTPTIQSHDLPEVIPSLFQAEDSTVLGADRPSRTATLRCYGVTSENVEALKQWHQKPIKFCFALKDGSVRVKKWESTATDIFFDAQLVTVSDLVQVSGNPADYAVLTISLAYGAMDSFQDVPNCSFLATK